MCVCVEATFQSVVIADRQHFLLYCISYKEIQNETSNGTGTRQQWRRRHRHAGIIYHSQINSNKTHFHRSANTKTKIIEINEKQIISREKFK